MSQNAKTIGRREKHYTKAEIAESLARAAALIGRANAQGLETDKWIESIVFLSERGDPEAERIVAAVLNEPDEA
jgi:hypothetical protein